MLEALSSVPAVLWYLLTLLAVVLVWFLALKRPVYEAVLVAFIVLVAVSGTWTQVPLFVKEALSEKTLFSMTAFVAMSVILTKTKVMDGVIAIILALLGRIPGGTGYVSVLASSFMGAMSGSGPGNVMATGSITVPSMKRSGFPPELAANIVSNASYMGNMIPPSSNIVAAMGAYAAFAGKEISTGQFWLVLWGIAMYFIAQRILMVYAFCKYYKVEAMKKEDIPKLADALRNGWKAIFLPAIVFVPFFITSKFDDFFVIMKF